jgi:hypothetical protein
MGFLQSLRFLYILMTKNNTRFVCESRQLVSATGKQFPLDRYYDPKCRNFRGTVLFIHGMNKLGNKDPRVIEICQALATCGFIALAPTYDNITQLLMQNVDISNIEESVQALLADPKLTPQGTLSIFTASYSGAIALRSITSPTIAHKVNAFCSIGSPSSPVKAFENALRDSKADHYAKLILIKNLLRLSLNFDPVLDTALDYAIDDAFMKDGQNKLDAFIEKQPRDVQAKIREITEENMNTAHLLEFYFPAVQQYEEEFISAGDFNNLRSEVALIHSASDCIFPYEETVNLYQQLRGHERSCRMLITPLLEHVDYTFSFKKLKQMWQLVSILAYFFRHAQNGR